MSLADHFRSAVRRPLGASLFFVVARANGAELENATSDVQWFAPAECANESSFNVRARASIDSSNDVPKARVTVKKTGARYAALVVFVSGSERSFDGETCAVIEDSVLLVLSLNATKKDPNRWREDARRLAELERPLPTPPRAANPDELRQIFFGLMPLVDAGTLPRTSPGLELHGGMAMAHARFEAALYGLLPVEKNSRVGVRGTFGASGAVLRGGWLFGDGPRFGPMIGIDFERWTGASRGADTNGDATAFVVSPELSAMADFSLGSAVHLLFALGGRFPLTRPPFVVDGIGEIHRAERVLGQARAGLDVRF